MSTSPVDIILVSDFNWYGRCLIDSVTGSRTEILSGIFGLMKHQTRNNQVVNFNLVAFDVIPIKRLYSIAFAFVAAAADSSYCPSYFKQSGLQTLKNCV